MKTSEFDFNLPVSLIAQEPADPRDCCNLMILERGIGRITHSRFFDILSWLKKGDVLIFNDSRVIPARINFVANGKNMEILLIREISDNLWTAIGKPGKLLKPENIFRINGKITFKILEKQADGEMTIRFFTDGRGLKHELVNIGKAPFPPYIKETHANISDYQTVYAKNDGSIAAPTAGLHFTNELLERLQMMGVQQEFVTLHVGLGTFLPVKTEELESHKMHSELYYLDKETAGRLNDAKAKGRRIIAVGTTSVRVLESSYIENYGFKEGYGDTDIFIYPGYKWKAVDGIVTNFHLPKSTLIMLVSAFAGKKLTFSAYNEAIDHHYRFYSFGDAMLIL